MATRPVFSAQNRSTAKRPCPIYVSSTCYLRHEQPVLRPDNCQSGCHKRPALYLGSVSPPGNDNRGGDIMEPFRIQAGRRGAMALARGLHLNTWHGPRAARRRRANRLGFDPVPAGADGRDFWARLSKGDDAPRRAVLDVLIANGQICAMYSTNWANAPRREPMNRTTRCSASIHDQTLTSVAAMMLVERRQTAC